jgi:hypothetical protein
MDHVLTIQEIVDTHKDEMPVYVATRLMGACQKLYESLRDQNGADTDQDPEAAEINFETEAAAMFRRAFAEGGLRGEELERRVRERVSEN